MKKLLQLYKWRLKLILGEGNKYYPKDLIEHLKHWDEENCPDSKKN